MEAIKRTPHECRGGEVATTAHDDHQARAVHQLTKPNTTAPSANTAISITPQLAKASVSKLSVRFGVGRRSGAAEAHE